MMIYDIFATRQQNSPKLDKTFMNQHGHKVASQIVSFPGQKDYSAQSFGSEFNVELERYQL